MSESNENMQDMGSAEGDTAAENALRSMLGIQPHFLHKLKVGDKIVLVCAMEQIQHPDVEYISHEGYMECAEELQQTYEAMRASVLSTFGLIVSAAPMESAPEGVTLQ